MSHGLTTSDVPRSPTTRRLLPSIVVGSALFAFYLPSSIGGVISQPLSVLSIAGSCVLLAGMWLTSERRAPALNVAAALGILFLVTIFTVLSPFEEISRGVALLYVAQSMLFLLNLRQLRSRAVQVAFLSMSVANLVLGYALAMDATIADRLVVLWYSAFYPELLSNMVVIDNKPVLTFATHSMAGFMIYLMFFMHLAAWRVRGGWWRLATAVAFLGLLVLLRSTTGQAFAGLAALQLLLLVRYIPARVRALTVVVLVIAGYFLFTARGLEVGALASQLSEAIVGDRVRGLFSRYAPGGVLASSMNYLAESPLSPIGLTATDALYLGDSGVVVNLLRGSVPLLIAVYGGLWLFLRTNLADRRAAILIWACTALFEIGFTPLQYFRFVAFVPLLVVYLNSAGMPRGQPEGLGARPGPG